MFRENRYKPRRVGRLIAAAVVAALVAGSVAYVMLAEFPPETRTTEKTLTDVSIKP